VIGAVIQNSTVAIFLGASFGILAVWFAIKRRFSQALVCFALASVAGAVLAAFFLINYVTTGLADDQTLLLLWRFANLEKLYQWGALLPVLTVHLGKTGMSTIHVPFSDALTYFIDAMRPYVFLPLFVSSIVVCAATAYYRWKKGAWPAMMAPYEIAVLAAMILVTVSLAMTAGQTQPVSFFRYSSFVVPLFIAGGILIWIQPIAASNSLSICFDLIFPDHHVARPIQKYCCIIADRQRLAFSDRDLQHRYRLYAARRLLVSFGSDLPGRAGRLCSGRSSDPYLVDEYSGLLHAAGLPD
jgi:hypothetical protein